MPGACSNARTAWCVTLAGRRWCAHTGSPRPGEADGRRARWAPSIPYGVAWHCRYRPAAQLPCVVYLHGNSSCRLGCLENLEIVLLEGATMFAFDTAGCGRSEGEWVTLGWNEKDDLAAGEVAALPRPAHGQPYNRDHSVISHLRGLGTVSSLALWGRSMGAATALLHAHRDPSIGGMILDSPFADLRQLATELVAQVSLISIHYAFSLSDCCFAGQGCHGLSRAWLCRERGVAHGMNFEWCNVSPSNMTR